MIYVDVSGDMGMSLDVSQMCHIHTSHYKHIAGVSWVCPGPLTGMV